MLSIEHKNMIDQLISYLKKVYPAADCVITNGEDGRSFSMMIADYPMIDLLFGENHMMINDIQLDYADPQFNPRNIVEIMYKIWHKFDKGMDTSAHKMTVRRNLPWLYEKILKCTAVTKKKIIPKKVKPPW